MKTRLLVCAAALICATESAHAQDPAKASGAPVILPAATQITAAISPLPEEFRAGATVLGYTSAGKSLMELRKGTGPYTCLADDPADEKRFHVACYHNSLEAFMARGRELRAMKVANVDSARFAEIDAGKLKMPTHPAALYSLTGKSEQFDAATGVLTGARPLYVVYIPFATPASTGISAKAGENTPWLMFPGTAKAHIMFVPRMQ
jgi:hypothetical protein